MEFNTMIDNINKLLYKLEQDFQCAYEFVYTDPTSKEIISNIFRSRIDCIDTFERMELVKKIMSEIDNIDKKSIIFLRLSVPQIGVEKVISITKSGVITDMNRSTQSNPTPQLYNLPEKSHIEDSIQDYENEKSLGSYRDDESCFECDNCIEDIPTYHRKLMDEFIVKFRDIFSSGSFSKTNIKNLIDEYNVKFEKSKICLNVVEWYMMKNGIRIHWL